MIFWDKQAVLSFVYKPCNSIGFLIDHYNGNHLVPYESLHYWRVYTSGLIEWLLIALAIIVLNCSLVLIEDLHISSLLLKLLLGWVSLVLRLKPQNLPLQNKWSTNWWDTRVYKFSWNVFLFPISGTFTLI